VAFAELKERQSRMWGNGPYERVTRTVRDVHATVVDRLDPRPGERWLDAACGTGAAAFLAAGRGADVTGVDFAPALLETARELAAGRGLDVRFALGDCEQLPFEDASFDGVLSTFGVMFAPDQGAVASELARVTRPGGRLGLACWTPEGGVGDLFRMMAPFAPPPPEGAGNPFDWGREEHVAGLLGDAFELTCERLDSPLELSSGEEYWELFSSSFGPAKTLAESLDDERRAAFRQAWIDWAESHRDGAGLVHHREYLLTLGTRR
jgi:SAM-dependent methyltransferase